MSNIIKIFFSPSQTTKNVVEQIASNFEKSSETYDLLNFNQNKEFNQEDIAIVGTPIDFAYLSPYITYGVRPLAASPITI